METIINKLPEDINYMFYIKPKGVKRFSTYNPGKGTMGTGRVFTELYRKEHLSAVCKWIAEDNSGDFAYQLRSGDGKKIYWEHNPIATQATETPQISTQTAETVNVSVEGEKGAKIGSNKAVEKAKTWLCPNNTFDIQPYGKNKALYICVDMDTPPRYHVMVAFWEKNSRYEGGKRFTNRQIDMDGKECYFDGSSFPTLQAAREFAARLLSEQPQSPETPQAVECTAGADKLAQTA